MKISKKFKKRLEISSFYKCTKNHDHRLYCSWDMVCDGCNCFWFWAIFYPFTPYQPKKCKFQKMKFTQVYQKSWSYAILFLRYGTWHWAICCPFKNGKHISEALFLFSYLIFPSQVQILTTDSQLTDGHHYSVTVWTHS